MDDTTTLAQIIAQLRTALPELRAQYGVRWLGVFGSYARDEQTPGSDLDILVEFDERALSLLDFIRLENTLSDRLAVNVDLVERRALKPRIGQRILSEVVPV